ncbi:TraV family lipoprotein [Vibrio sp. Makdt]|uniref:TraV family lipoprotein n=1 Tax=Vibrio sp. Makdt TaxID=2998828 RepID=UPI0022CD8543|nr:TraV family lipoprotein [Vibrio sp. Makdt]MDA0152466.1 TraV family lipoprotein [Vibrio sp. Makdt]
MSKLTKLTIALAATTVLGGCSAFQIGEEPPECSVDGQYGVECVTAREVWAATDTHANLEGMTAAEVRREAEKNDPARLRSSTSQQGDSSSLYSNNEQLEQPVNEPASAEERAAAYGRFQEERLHLPSPDPLAVREAPGILRVTVASYVDESDRLNFPPQVFAEVEKRTWTIGTKANENTNRITPTSVRATSRSITNTGLDTPDDNSGMGVKTRPNPKEYDFEGIIPNETPKLTYPNPYEK